MPAGKHRAVRFSRSMQGFSNGEVKLERLVELDPGGLRYRAKVVRLFFRMWQDIINHSLGFF